MNSYKAFISYRHADNKEQGRQWATWLHQSIEQYDIPADLVGTLNDIGEEIPSHIYPVFRDEEELPVHSNLENAITKALDKSETLVVLCSPRARESGYVNSEIEYYKKIGKSSRILAVIIDGEPNTSLDKGKVSAGFSESEECFPEALQWQYTSEGVKTDKRTEPVAADFRVNIDNKNQQGWTSIEAYSEHLKDSSNFSSKEIAEKTRLYAKKQQLMLLKIIASILHINVGKLSIRDVEYQIKLQKEKAKKFKRWLSIASLLGLIALGSSIFAYNQKKHVEVERNNALKTHSLFVTDLAKQELKKGNTTNAMLLALNALPTDYSIKDRPYVEEANNLLSTISTKYSVKNYLPALQFLAIYNEGKELLLHSNKNSSLYSLNQSTNKITVLHEDVSRQFEQLMIDEEDQYLITSQRSISNNKDILSYDLKTNKIISKYHFPSGLDFHSSINKEKNQLILISKTSLKIVSLPQLNELDHPNFLLKENEEFEKVSFSPKGDKIYATIVSSDEQEHSAKVKVWDINKHEIIFEYNIKEKRNLATLTTMDTDDGLYTVENYNEVFMWKYDGNNYAKKTRVFSINSDILELTYENKNSKLAAVTSDNLILINTNNIEDYLMIKHENSFQIASTYLGLQYTDNKKFLENILTQLSFSPNGKYIASKQKNIVYIWDSSSGMPINQFKGGDKIKEFTFSSDSKKIIYNVYHKLVSGAYSENVVINEIKPSNENRVIFDNSLSYAGISNDKDILIVADTDTLYKKDEVSSIYKMEAKNGLSAAPKKLVELKFPFGNHAIPTNLDGLVIEYSWYNTQPELLHYFDTEQQEFTQLYQNYRGSKFFSDGSATRIHSFNSLELNDNQQLLASTNFGYVYLRDLSSTEILWEYQTQAKSAIATFDYTKNFVLVGSRNGMIEKINALTGIASPLFHHDKSITAVSSSPSTPLMASASSDGVLQVWNLAQNIKLFENNDLTSVKEISFSPDGKYFAVCGVNDYEENIALLFNVEKKLPFKTLQLVGPCNQISYSPKSDKLTIATINGFVSQYDMTNNMSKNAILSNEGKRCFANYFDSGNKIMSWCKGKDFIQIDNNVLPINVIEKAISQLPANKKCLSPLQRNQFFLPKKNKNERKALGCLN